MKTNAIERLVKIPADSVEMEAMLEIPKGAKGIVLFAHGSGSGRLSPRNNFVANILQDNNLATLLMDLLTKEEDEIYENRFNIELLTERLMAATRWLQKQKETKKLIIGYFGSSTGATAALEAAAKLGSLIKAVVSRGGRPDLAKKVLNKVKTPTLLIVGGNDFGVIELNQEAYDLLEIEKKLEIIPGATHLFEEPGALEKVAHLAAEWFKKHLKQ